MIETFFHQIISNQFLLDTDFLISKNIFEGFVS